MFRRKKPPVSIIPPGWEPKQKYTIKWTLDAFSNEIEYTWHATRQVAGQETIAVAGSARTPDEVVLLAQNAIYEKEQYEAYREAHKGSLTIPPVVV